MWQPSMIEHIFMLCDLALRVHRFPSMSSIVVPLLAPLLGAVFKIVLLCASRLRPRHASAPAASTLFVPACGGATSSPPPIPRLLGRCGGQLLLLGGCTVRSLEASAEAAALSAFLLAWIAARSALRPRFLRRPGGRPLFFVMNAFETTHGP